MRVVRLVDVVVMLAAGLCVAACQKPENAAAKERMFAPPPPSPSQLKGKVKLDVSKVATDVETRKHLITMQFPEVHVRAGSGAFNVHEVLTLQKGEAGISVEEKGSILFNKRGDLGVDLSTGTTERMQLIYANEVMYTKNRAGSWRVSRDPAEERHFWADTTYSAFRTTLEMLGDDVSWTVSGHESVEGRKATQFTLALKGAPRELGLLGEGMDAGRTSVNLPDGGGLFAAAQDRRKAMKGGVPQSVQGTISVDDEWVVPLKVDLQVVMKLPGNKMREPQTVTIVLDNGLKDLGKDVDIKGPSEAVEEIVRRRVPPDPLEWLDAGGKPGAPKAAAKPGTPKPAPAPRTEEPADEGEE